VLDATHAASGLISDALADVDKEQRGRGRMLALATLNGSRGCRMLGCCAAAVGVCGGRVDAVGVCGGRVCGGRVCGGRVCGGRVDRCCRTLENVRHERRRHNVSWAAISSLAANTAEQSHTSRTRHAARYVPAAIKVWKGAVVGVCRVGQHAIQRATVVFDNPALVTGRGVQVDLRTACDGGRLGV
jgi:hypothetical protein